MPSKRPNGYLGRYRDADGREHSKLFRTEDGAPKTSARDWEQEQRAAVRRGTDIDPNAGKVKLAEFAERWRQDQVHHRAGTTDSVEMIFRVHVVPHLGKRPMARISRDAVQALVKRWAQDGAAPGTVAVRFAHLSAMFRSAVADGVIARSPCVHVRLPERLDPPVVPLTTDQVLALIDGVPRRLRPVLVVGAGLGVRINEALGLTIDRVQFLRREVVIDRQQEDRRPYRLVPRKNARVHPRYVLPLPDYVGAVLSTLTPGRDGRLFTAARGSGPLAASTVQGGIYRAVPRLGLPPGTSFHDLRHAYASRLIEHGESVVTVAARLGDSPATVLRHYGHLWPDSDERTRKIIDGMFGEDADQLRTTGAADGA